MAKRGFCSFFFSIHVHCDPSMCCVCVLNMPHFTYTMTGMLLHNQHIFVSFQIIRKKTTKCSRDIEKEKIDGPTTTKTMQMTNKDHIRHSRSFHGWACVCEWLMVLRVCDVIFFSSMLLFLLLWSYQTNARGRWSLVTHRNYTYICSAVVSALPVAHGAWNVPLPNLHDFSSSLNRPKGEEKSYINIEWANYCCR